MASPPPRSSRSFALARTVAIFALAWGVALRLASHPLSGVDAFVRDAIARVLGGLPSATWHAVAAYDALLEIGGGCLLVTLFFATLFGALGALLRMVVRARVRAGQPDPLARLRAWTVAHPRVSRALLAVPAMLWALFVVWPGPWELAHLAQWLTQIGDNLPVLLLTTWAIDATTRLGGRALLAPTIDGTAEETRFAIGPDEIAFDAVAVTPLSVGIVAAFTALMFAIPLLIAKLPILELYRHGTGVFYLFGGYAAFAATGALSFQKASRVSIGVDGIHVRGTSRARFVAYRDIDAARTNGNGDVEIVRRGRVVLRLQLHGEDASRRDAVLDRIRENVDRVLIGKSAPAAELVASASKEDLARFAHGAADYRAATLSREQLWALVEGPEVEGSARTRAAGALARSADDPERARLRVAAERCAEPRVRVALEVLAAEMDAQEPAALLSASRGRS